MRKKYYDYFYVELSLKGSIVRLVNEDKNGIVNITKFIFQNIVHQSIYINFNYP